MADELSKSRRKITPAAIRSRKNGGTPITLVTAYDYPFASYAEQAGIDIVFVSDALASVGMGCENTLSMTVDEVVYHTRAVRRAVSSSLVLASLPFLSYTTPADAVQNAGRLIRDGGADAVELEGSADLVPIVRALTKAGIAVVAHVGLTKVLAARTGSYRAQAQDAESAIAIIHDALTLSEAGAFALVLECIPDRIAAAITELASVPTIGIGAGGYCDGQGLVTQDMLGLFEKFTPKFVQKYAALGETARNSFRLFKENVESAAFPGSAHTLPIGDEKLGDIVARLNGAINGTPY
ncbi:MAG: 3-methyl-2-oxobutanoate hydroxymethyltransferase [Bradyrhizobium sp.]|uniref:3-methyl-2-oxobutanoate hydroxymethyltransferase n=1 Tax=Bradyrhizobium sp. TaxID=376 RepID=UPI00121EC22B|nr:3-methyl-2-oxobutanoate hydroxymethyltransferase [Bradyrhizobium sp.]THD63408.1 MAG: 3-methyl-2-oxobutanoate hydroxymethyltransferase [Bradyrhizobium sp.]